jgi:hypothetical protein
MDKTDLTMDKSAGACAPYMDEAKVDIPRPDRGEPGPGRRPGG